MPFFPKRVQAPDFPVDGIWLNVNQPLDLATLRGQVVLLDFWTYCCINCLHVLPDLHALETQFQDQLVVIGVHSPKFEEEKNPERVALALKRYEIHHPVFHDPSMRLWQEYGIRAWPTLVLLDREGRVAFAVSGEGQKDLLARAIAQLLADGTNRTPAHTGLQKTWQQENRDLWFPTKMAWGGGQLFIADTGHHRIVAVDPDGRMTAHWGGTEAGFAEGDGTQARFREPRGLVWINDELWVADTANHAVRSIDPSRGIIRTVFGDGIQSHRLLLPGNPGSIRSPVRLNSPWDIARSGQKLYLAMAGCHQIWLADTAKREIRPYAGTGQEALTEGSLIEATFAQPSGLCIAPDGLIYVADSESSSIRCIDPEHGVVSTLIGRGLFDFGDRDGGIRFARLQHPLAVTWRDGRVWIADTYNSKIKVLDPQEGKITTVEIDAELNEPEGILDTPAGLFIADTNQHRILLVDPDKGSAQVFHG
ncbi:alkyl hydroperoxide reductase/ Thiol specific antioxidant/ Mal allergen [mine drainage metagenome]|uniref:Alkyl hydroperoxide reductase/ Thiol specific antioxidant/ Mal allergen n=3 Tax=mine drainage metagenome TaxID=410659 RepID=T1C8C1_9ZZZZ